jgi:hypothetical protein
MTRLDYSVLNLKIVEGKSRKAGCTYFKTGYIISTMTDNENFILGMEARLFHPSKNCQLNQCTNFKKICSLLQV